MSTAPVTVRVPGKINLQLSVGPRRADGFHELATIFLAVSRYDEVTLSPAAEAGVAVATVGVDAERVPQSADNLAVRAVEAVAQHLDIEPSVHLNIHKSIPVAAGMAGGSADAAAALVAADALWEGRLSRPELLNLAAGLGSDVPFLLAGGVAVGTGRGERIAPALCRGEFHWVLAVAKEGLATAGVYAELDRLRASDKVPHPEVSAGVLAALAAGNAPALAKCLANDLGEAALSLRPTLGRVLEFGAESGALGGLVSGSGPTCAFLAESESAALDLAVAFSASGMCRTVAHAVGPVPGATVTTRRNG